MQHRLASTWAGVLPLQSRLDDTQKRSYDAIYEGHLIMLSKKVCAQISRFISLSQYHAAI